MLHRESHNMMEQSKEYDEKELLARLQTPRLQAETFSCLVKKYSEQLYRHIRSMVLNHDDADDILQNTFVKAWMNIGKFRGDSQLSTWLYRIAINETLTFIGRKQAQTVSLNTPEGAIAEQLESDVLFNGDRAQALFAEAVSRLPEKQRLVFNMKYYDELKYEEISEILGTSVGALKASYHIAVKKIESFLNDGN